MWTDLDLRSCRFYRTSFLEETGMQSSLYWRRNLIKGNQAVNLVIHIYCFLRSCHTILRDKFATRQLPFNQKFYKFRFKFEYILLSRQIDSFVFLL